MSGAACASRCPWGARKRAGMSVISFLNAGDWSLDWLVRCVASTAVLTSYSLACSFTSCIRDLAWKATKLNCADFKLLYLPAGVFWLMSLEKLMPSALRHSHKVVKHLTLSYPQKVWVSVLATDWHVLEQVPVLLALLYCSHVCECLRLTVTCCARHVSKGHTLSVTPCPHAKAGWRGTIGCDLEECLSFPPHATVFSLVLTRPIRQPLTKFST